MHKKTDCLTQQRVAVCFLLLTCPFDLDTIFYFENRILGLLCMKVLAYKVSLRQQASMNPTVSMYANLLSVVNRRYLPLWIHVFIRKAFIRNDALKANDLRKS